jgi:hypothetical protein
MSIPIQQMKLPASCYNSIFDCTTELSWSQDSQQCYITCPAASDMSYGAVVTKGGPQVNVPPTTQTKNVTRGADQSGACMASRTQGLPVGPVGRWDQL